MDNMNPQPLILRGTVVRVLPVVDGVSKSGNNWRRRQFVLETESQYPRTVCFQIWNERIETYPINEGSHVDVRFSVESREFNERWYTDLTAIDITPVQESESTSAPNFSGQQPYNVSAQGYATQAPQVNQFGGGFDPTADSGADDLPF